MGDRDGYPGRGLSGWRERAGSVQHNFLGPVRHQTKTLAGTGLGFGPIAGSPVMMKSLGMVLVGAAAKPSPMECLRNSPSANLRHAS